jgi:hypothetical protein
MKTHLMRNVFYQDAVVLAHLTMTSHPSPDICLSYSPTISTNHTFYEDSSDEKCVLSRWQSFWHTYDVTSVSWYLFVSATILQPQPTTFYEDSSDEKIMWFIKMAVVQLFCHTWLWRHIRLLIFVYATILQPQPNTLAA